MPGAFRIVCSRASGRRKIVVRVARRGERASVKAAASLVRSVIHEISKMTETQWYWADHDGTPKPTSRAILLTSLSLSALPPFVLVWHTGMRHWLPAYLVDDLAKELGIEDLEELELDPALTEPPLPPLEWYYDCFGGPPPNPLSQHSAGMAETRNMNIGPSFDPHQMQTVANRNKPIPIGAFRSIDAYLAHIRALREKR